MSNGVDAPQGMQPFSHYNGATWNEQTQNYRIASGYAANIFKGDPVVLRPGGVPPAGGTIERYAAAGAPRMLGVFWGCEYYDANGVLQYSNYWPTGTIVGPKGTFAGSLYANAYIITDLSVVYTIQMILGTATVIVRNIGQNAEFDMAAGNTSTGISKVEINQTTIAATATLPVKIVGISPTPNVNNVPNWNYGVVPNNNALVMMNDSVFHNGTAGVV